MSFKTILLDAGAKALAQAFAQNRSLKVIGFRLGSQHNFEASSADTDVNGFVFRGNTDHISYRQVDGNQVEFLIEMDASIGDFLIGNYVILLEGDIPLCKAVHTLQFSKEKSTDTKTGNFLTLTCMAKYADIQAILNINVQAAAYAQLPVLVNENSLPVDPSLSTYTQYVLNDHTTVRRPVVVMAHTSTNRWHGNALFQRMDHPFFGSIFGGETGDEYMLYEGRLTDNSNKNKSFWKNVGLIKENAKENSGLIGISISKKIFGNEAWTMTVWETEEDLENFIISKRHSQAIDESEEALSNSKFARLKMKRKEIPLAWDKALNILAEQKSRFHTYYDN